MRYILLLIAFLFLTGFFKAPTNLSMRMSTGGGGGEVTFEAYRVWNGSAFEDYKVWNGSAFETYNVRQ